MASRKSRTTSPVFHSQTISDALALVELEAAMDLKFPFVF